MCSELTTGSFHVLVNLTVLNCVFCHQLEDGSFDGLVNLTKIYCLGCDKLTAEYLKTLARSVKFDWHIDSSGDE